MPNNNEGRIGRITVTYPVMAPRLAMVKAYRVMASPGYRGQDLVISPEYLGIQNYIGCHESKTEWIDYGPWDKEKYRARAEELDRGPDRNVVVAHCFSPDKGRFSVIVRDARGGDMSEEYFDEVGEARKRAKSRGSRGARDTTAG